MILSTPHNRPSYWGRVNVKDGAAASAWLTAHPGCGINYADVIIFDNVADEKYFSHVLSFPKCASDCPMVGGEDWRCRAQYEKQCSPGQPCGQGRAGSGMVGTVRGLEQWWRVSGGGDSEPSHQPPQLQPTWRSIRDE